MKVPPRWTVSVAKPRKNEGHSLRLRFRPNTTLRKSGCRERRINITTQDSTVAEKQASQWQRRLNAPLRTSNGPTFVEIYNKFLADRQAEAEANPETIANFRNAGVHLAAAFDGVEADEISEATILLAQDYLKTHTSLAPSTINLYMRLGAKAWRWAKKRKLVTTVWVLDREDRLEEIDSDKRPMTPVELDSFLEWLEDYREGRWVTFFLVLSETSCRVSEIRLLKEGQLDRETGAVFVRSHRSRRSSKRNKDIACSRETAALVPERQHGELLFPGFGKDKSRPVSGEQARRILKKWAEQALPDPENIDTHSLRRSWIQDARRAGVPDAIGQRQTGISSVEVYSGYQRNAVGDDLHEALERVLAYRRLKVAEHRAKQREQGAA